MKKYNKLIIIPLVFLALQPSYTSANQTFLIGTKEKFENSVVCKSYKCELASTLDIAPQTKEKRYRIVKNPKQDRFNWEILIISIITVREIVYSVGFSVGCQDYPLYNESFENKIGISLIKSVTGLIMNPLTLEKLSKNTFTLNFNNGKEQIAYISKENKIFLAFLYSNEFSNANLCTFRIGITG